MGRRNKSSYKVITCLKESESPLTAEEIHDVIQLCDLRYTKRVLARLVKEKQIKYEGTGFRGDKRKYLLIER